jgi:Protein of unknown function (DUF2846)
MRCLTVLISLAAGLMLAACQGRVTEPVMASVSVPPVTAGMARIYFYRDWEPYESLSRPRIYLNQAPADISEPGGISFRDLPPAEYYISVDSQGLYPHQFKTLVLRSGDIRYVKIESLKDWITNSRLWYRDTFVVEFIPERQAQGEIGDMRYIPGAS